VQDCQPLAGLPGGEPADVGDVDAEAGQVSDLPELVKSSV